MSKKEFLFMPIKSDPDIEYLSADNSKITDGLKYNESEIKLENNTDVLHIKQEYIDIKDEIQMVDNNQDVQNVHLTHAIRNSANSKKPNQELDQPEKLFACISCEFKAISKSHLSSHAKIHSGKLFYCNLCEYKTTQKYMLIRHVRTHTGEKPFKCNLCKYKFSRKDSLLIHESSHRREKLFAFACNMCEFKTVWKRNLTIHKRVHKGKKPSRKPFACCICGLKYSVKSDLLIHESTHIEEFPCNMCDFKSSQKIHLIVHLKTHNQEKLLSCNLCTFETTEKSLLTTHMSMHKQEKLPISSLTKFTISSDSNVPLTSHGDKYQVASKVLFACHLCEFKTTFKNCLMFHYREIHKFVCNLCTFETTKKSLLTTHMSMHKQEKLPIPKLSKFTISSDSNAPLTFHADKKYQVASEELFVCHICEFQTTEKLQLITHMSMHKEKRLSVSNSNKFTVTSDSSAPSTSHADKYQIASKVLLACHLCEFKTTFKNCLMFHYREIHKFVCNLCIFQTTEKSQLEKHIKTHFGLYT